MMPFTQAYVALGANLGKARLTLQQVIDEIGQADDNQLIKQSAFYSSPPFGEGADGPDYVNAVVLIQTRMPPMELLDYLQSLELSHGRERLYRNAPRTIDLDILLYGDQTIEQERLHIPHPRMQERAFVLLPLHDIDPDLSWHDPIGTLYQLNECIARMPEQTIHRMDE